MNTMKLALVGALLGLACDARPLFEADVATPDVRPAPTRPCVMPLQKAHLTIPLGASLQTNLDDKQLPIGGMLEIQNMRPGRVGELVPRFSTVALGTGLLGTADTLPTPWSLATWKDCLVSLSGVGKHPLNVWSPTAGQWVTDVLNLSTFEQVGGVRTLRRGPVVAQSNRIAGNGKSPNIDYANGYYFVSYVSTNASGGTLLVNEVIIDATTGDTVLQRTFNDSLSSASNGVKVVNGYAVFVRSTTASDIAFDAWLISNLDAGPTTTVFATTQAVNNTFDVMVKDATTISVLFHDLGTTKIGAVDFVPSTGVTTGWAPRDAAAAAINPGSAGRWMQDLAASGKIAIVNHDGANLVVHWNIPTAGATRQAATSTTLAAVANLSNVASNTITSNAAGEYIVVYDYVPPLSVATTVIFERFGGLTFGGSTFYGAMGLASNTFRQNGEYFVWLEYESGASTQGVRYLVRIDTDYIVAHTPGPGGILAKSEVNRGGIGSATPNNTCAAVVSPSANTWVTAEHVTTRLNVSTTLTWSLGVDLVSTTFKQPGDTTTGAPKEALNGLLVPGGSLAFFDGREYGEVGFAYYPDSSQITLGAAAGGSMTASATYYYRLVYARTDAAGQVWRSRPSDLKSIAMGANTKVNLGWQSLQLTDHSSALGFATSERSRETVEIYRGDANDSNNLRLLAAVANDIGLTTGSFVDTTADGFGGEPLYTNGGGVLPNDPIPGALAVAVTPTRALIVSADDPQVLWPSAPFVPGIGLRFSEATQLQVRDQHGAITGLASQPNGSVVVFKKDAVYLLTGDGPDAAGRGGFQLTMVASGLGTTNPRSIVETSLGTEFQSTSTKAGWWRIGLGGTPEYIGGPVERYIGSTVVGAVMIPTASETRYYLATGGSLVHRFDRDMWMIDTGTAATCATAYGGGAAYGTAGPGVITDNTAQIGLDGGFAYTINVTTPWIKLGDLRGYERMYRVRGVGELGSPETNALLLVALQKDMIQTNVVAQQVPSSGLSRTFEWEMRYSAKFESVRFVLTDQPGFYDTPSAYKLSAIVLEYGVRKGLRPISSSNRTV